MSNTNTGGPAFPIVVGDQMTQGMTMRDYFAAKAMQSIYAANVEWKPTGTPMDEESLQLLADVAQDAYKMADAMLKAREA
jgi:hypothetical protein